MRTRWLATSPIYDEAKKAQIAATLPKQTMTWGLGKTLAERIMEGTQERAILTGLDARQQPTISEMLNWGPDAWEAAKRMGLIDPDSPPGSSSSSE